MVKLSKLQTNIKKALEQKNLETLKFLFNNLIENGNAKKIPDELAKVISDDGDNFFQYAVKNSSLDIVKYLFEFNNNLEAMDQICDIAAQRDDSSIQNFLSELREQKKLHQQLEDNRKQHQKDLFELDAEIFQKISNLLDGIAKLYEANQFLTGGYKHRFQLKLSDMQDDLLEGYKYADEARYDLEILKSLSDVSEYIKLLGNHENSLKNKLEKIIPWDVVEDLYINLDDAIQKSINPRKFLETLSSEIFRLSKIFSTYAQKFEKEGSAFSLHTSSSSQDMFPQLAKVCWLRNNQKILSIILHNIDLIEKYNLDGADSRYGFLQSLLTIGELIKHLSNDVQEILKEHGFFGHLKTFRNDLNHKILENSFNTAKLFKFLDDANLSYEKLKSIKDLIAFAFRGLILNIKDNLDPIFKQEKEIPLLEDKVKIENNKKKAVLVKELVPKISNIELTDSDKSKFLGGSYVASKMKTIKYSITQIRDLIGKVEEDKKQDYDAIRETLKLPEYHFKFLFLLTVIGDAVQALKGKDVFLSLVSVELLRQLDFLKWVRNSLMHFDTIDEDGTIVDYLANDLFKDRSIDTHGEKVLEFGEYFKYILTLVDYFQGRLDTTGSKYYDQYQDQNDQKYYKEYVSSRSKKLEQLENKISESTAKTRSLLGFSSKAPKERNIEFLLDRKTEIAKKAEELGIKIIGVFSKLARFGQSEEGDNSGFLVESVPDNMLGNLSTFKQYLQDLLGYRLKVVEKKQLSEYFKTHIHDDTKRLDYEKDFLEKAARHDLDHIENNIKILEMIETFRARTGAPSMEDILLQLLTPGQLFLDQEELSFDDLVRTKNEIIEFINLNSQLNFDLILYGEQPVLHKLVDIYRQVLFNKKLQGQDKTKTRSLICDILQVVLQKCNIAVADNDGNNILHMLASDCDEGLLRVFSGSLDRLDANSENVDKKCPLAIAVQYHNARLIELLIPKTDIKKYNLQLLIAAVKSANIEFLKYLIDNYKVDLNVCDEEGMPILHYAIYHREYKNKFHDIEQEQNLLSQYRETIKLLLERGVEVSGYQRSQQKELPLLWALENDDTELALLMARNSTTVNYYGRVKKTNLDTHECSPAHLAILNLKTCAPEDRAKYIEIIQIIAQKSENSLDWELNRGQETPLYLAALQEEVHAMRILIENGANANYKPHRFDQIVSAVKNLEVIKIFVENGIRIDYACLAKTRNINPGIKEYFQKHAELFVLYQNGEIEEIKKLAKEYKDINLNAVDKEGKNLFWYAVQDKNTEFILWLVKDTEVNLSAEFHNPYSDTFARDKDFNYYRHVADNANGQVLTLLDHRGFIAWEKFSDYEISLLSTHAIQNDDLESLKKLDQKKYIYLELQKYNKLCVNSNARKYLQKYVDVYRAIENDNLSFEEVKQLINALPNKLVLIKLGYDTFTLLHKAVLKNNLALVKFLVNEVGIHINIRNDFDETSLDLAVSKGIQNEILEYLISKEAIFSQNLDFDELLTLEAEKQKLLLQYIKQSPKILEDILKLASRYISNPDALKLFLDLGWNPNEYEESGYTPLHRCLANKYNDSIEILLKSGVDIEAPIANMIVFFTTGARTPLGWALEHENFVAAKLLVEKGASPYKYLMLLLYDALRNEDLEYVKLLLDRSIVVDEDNDHMPDWKNADMSELYRAIKYLSHIKHEIEDKLPEYIYNNIAFNAFNILLPLVDASSDPEGLVEELIEMMKSYIEDEKCGTHMEAIHLLWKIAGFSRESAKKISELLIEPNNANSFLCDNHDYIDFEAEQQLLNEFREEYVTSLLGLT